MTDDPPVYVVTPTGITRFENATEWAEHTA